MDKVKVGVIAGLKEEFEAVITGSDPDHYIHVTELGDVPDRLQYFMSVGKHLDGKNDELNGQKRALESACRKAVVKHEEEVAEDRQNIVPDKRGYTMKERQEGKPEKDREETKKRNKELKETQDRKDKK